MSSLCTQDGTRSPGPGRLCPLICLITGAMQSGVANHATLGVLRAAWSHLEHQCSLCWLGHKDVAAGI